MKNFCGKCGSKLNPETGLCPKCSKELQIVKKETIEKNQKKKIVSMILIVVLFFCCLCTVIGLAYFNVLDIPVISDFMKGQNVEDNLADEEYIEANIYERVNSDCIVIEEKSIEMKNETEGSAVISVKIPNYEQLYKEALNAENPDEYLLNALKEKDFTTVEYEEEVPITVEGTKKVIHSEETVQQLLEKELIKTINALTEEEMVNEENN